MEPCIKLMLSRENLSFLSLAEFSLLVLRLRVCEIRTLVRRLINVIRSERSKLERYQKIEIETDNALIGAKDQLYSYVNSGDLDRLLFVTQYLKLSIDIWDALGYSYKGAEICCQIIHNLENRLEETPRQAYKQRCTLERNIRETKALRSRFYVRSNKFFRSQV